MQATVTVIPFPTRPPTVDDPKPGPCAPLVRLPRPEVLEVEAVRMAA